jgi:hypothetical protein
VVQGKVFVFDVELITDPDYRRWEAAIDCLERQFPCVP